ncbi:MAG: ABC-type transport auxiliary lipoprotein family protein [Pontixanthobacter sp.]
MIRPFKSGFAVLAIFALAGCISFGPEAPESLLTLTATDSAPVGFANTGNAATAIAIMEPDAPQSINVTRVPVQIDATEIAYIEGATWVEKPARLFQRLLAETIRARGTRMVVDSDEDALVPETRLRGTLREFGFDARTGSVVVRYDAVRSSGGGTVQTRRFESVQPGVVPLAAPVGAALNAGANDVAAQVAAWVG